MKKHKKKTASFLEDRSLIWSTNISESVVPISGELCRQKLFDMFIFRNSIRSGTKICCRWHKSHLDDILESLYKLRTRASSQIFETRILRPETDIMRQGLRSRIRRHNSVYKKFLEIVGNGKPTGNVWKETIAVSATIWISVDKLHHQIRLRILSCSRRRENHREPEVLEEEVPVVECLDGFARITSKEFAQLHSVKWHPPECLFYKTWREREEEDKTRKNNARSNMWHHGWNADGVNAHAATPWATMWCVHKVKVFEKSLVWVYLSTKVTQTGTCSWRFLSNRRRSSTCSVKNQKDLIVEMGNN